MTEEQKPSVEEEAAGVVDPPVSDEALAEQERAMAVLFAKARDATEPARTPLLLPGVQKKLRERSRGKFFGDGWSTSQAHLAYGLVAVIMLLILGVAYVVLSPSVIR